MEREAASQAKMRREMVEEGKMKNKMMKYRIDDALKILNLTSKNDGRETSFHDLCMPPGFVENTDVIRGHPHSHILKYCKRKSSQTV